MHGNVAINALNSESRDWEWIPEYVEYVLPHAPSVRKISEQNYPSLFISDA
jgi:hypothetical protein